MDLAGQRFGRLLVLHRGPRDRWGHPQWHCRCECGVEVDTLQAGLTSGHSSSCGCLKKQRLDEARTIHGKTDTPEHRAWRAMKRRCYNPNTRDYPLYGARGIAVDDRWRDSFETFLRDMGLKPTPVHSLDRIDSNGPYAPGNTRWAEPLAQGNNTRRNRRLELDGESRTVAEWARHLGIGATTIQARLRLGWSIERVLS
jgi:hypothetical protein